MCWGSHDSYNVRFGCAGIVLVVVMYLINLL